MVKKRKLFCQISPLTYRISALKCRTIRRVSNLFLQRRPANSKLQEPLPYLLCSHRSLIRRKLVGVDPILQDNKAINLSITAPKINGIIIRPKQMFSFWALVGACTKKKGYKEGLMLRNGSLEKGIGGGMCQMTNLIHWLVLHTPLTITEHHHHDGVDIFPDCDRTVPFGTGTSILYNYLDYRFVNNTDAIYQLNMDDPRISVR